MNTKSIQLKTSIPGPRSKEIVARRLAAVPTALGKSTDIAVAKADNCIVWDVDGNQLLDFAGGIGMMNAGHRNPNVVNAIKNQLDHFINTCSLVTTPECYVELAELLNTITPGQHAKKTLLTNTGAEAVENAVMIAKYYTKRPAVVCFEGAYHGRSFLTLTLTSKYNLFKKGFGSFASDVYRLPAPNLYRTPQGMSQEVYLDWCIQKLEDALISHVEPEAIAAFIIEPVQGEGGFIPMPQRFLEKIRQICTRHGIVMIADEVQSGSARTGKMFAIEHSGIVPDIITMAKSMGSGMPISAVVGRAEIMDALHVGAVGGTYGGSPLAVVAAIETLKLMSQPAFLSRAAEVGNRMKTRIQSWMDKYTVIGDVRGLGAMLAIEFVKNRDTKEPDADLNMAIIKEAQSNGLIIIRAGLYVNCIRLLPPLTISNEQIDEGLDVLEHAIQKVLQTR